MQPGPVEEVALQAGKAGPQAENEHQHAHAHHDAETPEDDGRRGPLVLRKGIEADQRRVEAVGEDQRAEQRDLHGIVRGARRLVRHAEQDERRAAIRIGLEVPFDGGNLGRLIGQRVEAVRIACEELDRRHQQRHPHRHGEHDARPAICRLLQQVPCARGANHERGGEVGRKHHVHEAIGERWVEDDGKPVLRHELALRVDGVALRRLHPAVDAEDPEGGEQGAASHDGGGQHVQALAHPPAAEQHDAEEARLEEEGGQHLIADERPKHRAHLVREDGPVGAELIGHHHAGHDAHAEDHGEHRLPLLEQGKIDFVARPQPQAVEHREVAGEADGEGGENDVRRDGEGELHSRQVECGDVAQHGDGLFPASNPSSTADVPPVAPSSSLTLALTAAR